MRHLILLLPVIFISACATVDTPVTTTPVTQTPEVEPIYEVDDSASSLARYLRDYLAKNIGDRARTSRSLIDRSGIESNGRLPSTSLFQSLGYRMRDAFVAMPPEMNSRNFADAESDLHPKLIHDLERTWALLDTTRARLKSQGGLEAGRQGWEVAVTRRNLALEGIAYWYQLRNQKNHSEWLLNLGDRTNELYDEISNARQNYDVQDLREHEFVLLNLRADVASLFQFFSSEQARLYNRIGDRVLPERRSNEQPLFPQRLECQANSKPDEKGLAYLNRYYRSRVEKILTSNYKASAYELNELAREVSSQALEIHSSRIKGIEQDYIIKRAQAQQQRNTEIELFKQRQRALVEIGQVVDPQALENLKNSPLDVARQNSQPTEAEDLLYRAVTVLADIASEKLLSVNQSRLKRLLLDADQVYQVNRNEIWTGSTEEARVLHNLLLDIYDHSLADYLLGYERLAFINQAMLHGCGINDKINQRTIGFDPQSVNDLASLVENYFMSNFSAQYLAEKLKEHDDLVMAFSSSVIGQGYQVGESVDVETGAVASAFEFNSQEGQAVLVSAKQQEYDRINTLLVGQGLGLASKDDAFEFAQGRGYTLELAKTESLSEAVDLFKRYAPEGKGLIYRSIQDSTQKVILTVVVGQERDYDDIVAYQKRLKVGVLKSFSEVRNGIYDE